MPVTTVVLILGLALIAYTALRAVLAHRTAAGERRVELLEIAAAAGPEAAQVVLAGLQYDNDRDLGYRLMELRLGIAELTSDTLGLELRMARDGIYVGDPPRRRQLP